MGVGSVCGPTVSLWIVMKSNVVANLVAKTVVAQCTILHGGADGVAIANGVQVGDPTAPGPKTVD